MGCFINVAQSVLRCCGCWESWDQKTCGKPSQSVLSLCDLTICQKIKRELGDGGKMVNWNCGHRRVEGVRGEAASSPLWPQEGPAIPLKEIGRLKLSPGRRGTVPIRDPLEQQHPNSQGTEGGVALSVQALCRPHSASTTGQQLGQPFCLRHRSQSTITVS